MKEKIKRRWIAVTLIIAIFAGITASHFSSYAHEESEPTIEEATPRLMIKGNEPTSESPRNSNPHVNLYINNVKVAETSYLINDTTYVPLRAFSEQVDHAVITWNNGIATIQSSTINMSVQQGSHYINANDRIIYHNSPILNINSRIYVPVRSLAKAYNLNVIWDGKTKSVYLAGNPKALKHGKDYYAEEDLYWLSRIIHAESSGESLKGKIAVGNVVVNRMKRSDYPNTIKGVIFDKKYGTQFSPVANGTIYNTPGKESILAAKIVLDGYSLNDRMIFFINPKLATNFWITQNRTFVMKIGNHAFYQ